MRALQRGDPDPEKDDRDREPDGKHRQRRLLERHRGGAYEVRYPRLSVAKKHRVRARSRRAVEAARRASAPRVTTYEREPARTAVARPQRDSARGGTSRARRTASAAP